MSKHTPLHIQIHTHRSLPPSQPSKTLPLKETPAFKYLGLTLDPYLTVDVARKHICRKINAAHETVVTVAHSLRHDSPALHRSIRSSPYVFPRIWQPCVLGSATETLCYRVTNAQIDAAERTLIHLLQRTLHCFTSAHITMIERGIPPPIIQQTLQLVDLHFRYTVLYTDTTAKFYHLRCKFCCSNAHPQHTIENTVDKAHSTLMIDSITYPGPPLTPRLVTFANPKNRGKSYTTFLKPIVSAEWLRLIPLKYPHAPRAQPPSVNVSSRPHAHFLPHHLSLCNNLYKLPSHLTTCGHCNPMSLLRPRSQSHQSIPTHMLTIDNNQPTKHLRRSIVSLLSIRGDWLGNPHLILECPKTCHVALDLIQLLTNLLYHDWLDYPDNTPTNLFYSRRPPIHATQEVPSHLVEVNPPAILVYVSQLEIFLYNTA